MPVLLNPYRYVDPVTWTQRLDFLSGTGAFPDSNGWALTGQTSRRTFVSGEGMRILDDSTSASQLCQFVETDIDPGDAPFHMRFTVKVASASSDSFAAYAAAYGSDRGVELILRTTKIRWQGLNNVDITTDMTTPRQVDLLRVADDLWFLFLDGVLVNHGAGLVTTANKVDMGAGSSTATSDTTWEDMACKVGLAYMPNGRVIRSYQSVTASGQVKASVGGLSHEAFPGVVLCPNGSFLAAWRSGASHDSADGEVKQSISTDQGATWAASTTIFTTGTDLRDVALSRDGDRILITFTDTVGADDHVPYFSYSDDNGSTWATAVAIDHGFSDWAFVSAPIVVDNGDWYVPLYGKDTGDANWSVVIVKSTDDGANWTVISTVWDGTTAGDNGAEGNLIQVGNEWICALRRETAGNIGFYVASSPAGPWTLRSTLPGLGRPTMAHINDQLWVMNRNTTRRISQSYNAAGYWVPSFNTTVGASSATWVYGQMAERPDGKVVIVYANEDNDRLASSVESDLLAVGR